MEKVRVAVIGCGSISVMHLDSAAALPEAELVAVCDIKEELAVAAGKKYGVPFYTDYREMFAREKLDAVHLCLPHYLHTPVAEEAFRAGLHVISEKPMSIRYEDAVHAVEVAEECDRLYGVIFQSRYNTPARRIKERVEDGRLGRVRCARVVLTWYRPDDYYGSSDWKGTWEKEGGGVIIDQAIHSIDLATWIIDSKPTRVQSTLHNRHHEIMVVEDTAEGLVEFENGAFLSFYAMNNYLVDEPIEIRLLCENGKATLTYENAVITYADGTEERLYNPALESFRYSGGKDYWGTRHIVQIRQFYRAILGLEPLELSGREALRTTGIICDIYKNNDNPFYSK